MRVVLLVALLTACSAPPPVPTISDAGPWLTCANSDTPQELDIRGQHFSPVLTGALETNPRVHTPRVLFVQGDELRAVPQERITIKSDDWMTVSVDRGLALAPGGHDLVVDNGLGADARLPDVLRVVDAPQLESIAPDAFCPGSDTVSLTITGTQLLGLDGVLPTVWLGDEAWTPHSAIGCAAVEPFDGLQECTAVVVDVPAASFAEGVVSVSVEDASSAECGLSLPISLQVLPPPTVSAATPDQQCVTGGTLEITGADFVDGSEVWADDVLLGDATAIDPWTLRVEIPENELPVGQYDLAVVSPGGCRAIMPDALTVRSAPVVFAVDPPVVPAGVPIQGQARLSDVFQDITRATLSDADGVDYPFSWTWSDSTPDLLAFTVPADLPAGVYTLAVDQGDACPGTPGASLTVIDTLDIPLDRVEPAFAWAYDDTPVDILTENPLSIDQTGIQEGSRAWLVRADGGGDAQRLRGVYRASETAMSGVVPWGLEQGEYDLLVVNPDGTAGRLSPAIKVVADPPPRVDALRPGTIENSGSPTVLVQGANFRAPTVSLTCRDGASEQVLTPTVVTSTRSRIELQVTPTGINQAVCVATVTNEDGTQVKYSALTITNPAQNLFPWQEGPDLVEARRAPAAAAGRTTSVRRWLYAIGGDDGDESSAKSTIEVAPVGVYGDLGDWWTLPRALPSARTLASVAVVPPFVYLIGGSDGATTVDTTWRARILDPLDVPWFEDVSLASTTDGLSAGTWTWRVSARFPPDDPNNPSGETLAADPLPVTLPDGDGWAVTLTWTEVAGASGYRVYRTPAAAGITGTEEWIADTEEPLLLDDGLPTDPSLRPLAEGALGAWAEVATLGTPRKGACLAQAPDPHPDPEAIHLYVAGGSDASDTVLSSIERLTVLVETPDSQAVGTWEDAGVSLSRARQRCAGMTIDSRMHTVVEEGESWVVFAGGATRTGAVGTVDTAYVDEYGALVDMNTQRDLTPARAGFAGVSASNFLYAFGGQQDRPSATGASSRLDAASIPNIGAWNSLGTSMSVDRWLPGSATESAVMFVVGGQTNSDSASVSVDWTNF